jgi:hypothetical protein
MTYSWDCSKSHTTDITSGAGTANPFGAPEYTLLICEIRLLCFLCSVLDIIVRPLTLFPLVIVSSLLQLRASDYPFEIFKHFVYMYCVTVTVPIYSCKDVLGDFIKTLLDSNCIDI